MDVRYGSMDQPAPLSLVEPRRGFRHEALFYADDDEFLAGITSFVHDGMESDEPTLVVLDAPKLGAVRSALTEDAERVFFADMGEVGDNPARIIPAWREFVDRYSALGPGLRG